MTRKATYLGSALILTMGLGLAGAAQAQALAQRGDGPMGPNIETMFQQFDTNGDGNVSREEIDAYMAQRFEDADTNGDGVLSPDETFAAAEARRAEREEMRRRARSDAMFSRLDADGNGSLSTEELANRPGPERMFDRFDTDGNGEISTAEMEQMKQRFADHRGRDGRGWHHGGDRRGEHQGPGFHQRPPAAPQGAAPKQDNG